jgi:Domain of unknown function (DUF1840)
MLVKFTTRHGQLLMLGEPAVSLLRLGGHSGSVPSAVLAADLPGFIAKLRAGLAVRGEEPSPSPPARTPSDQDDASDEPRERQVNLRQRAVPLLEMLDTAVAQRSDLVWERA